MVYSAAGLIAMGTIPSAVTAVRRWARGQPSEEEEKPQRILQHYNDINDRVFKKWLKQDSAKSCYCILQTESHQGIMEIITARIPEFQAPIPIFYQVFPPGEDLEWTVRAFRHLTARRYRKMMKVIQHILRLEGKHNEEMFVLLNNIQNDVNQLTLEYPLVSENENYQKVIMISAILQLAQPEIDGTRIVVRSGDENRVLATINDAAIRRLVLGKLQLLLRKYSSRRISGADMEVPRLLEVRNNYVGRIIHEIEANHLLEGKCDYEDPSQPIAESVPEW